MADQTCEETFLAEQVIDSGFGEQDGKRYYKIKWVRYTWESEDAVTHLKHLLDVFWSEHNGLSPAQETTKEQTELNDNIAQTELKVDEVVTDVNLNVEVTSVKADDLSKKDQGTIDSAIHKDVSLNDAREVGISADDDVTTIMSNPTASSNITKTILCPLQEKLTCNTCLKPFKSLHALRAHAKSHHTEKSFQCEHCRKTFSERSTLKRHMFIHLEEKPFKCDHCERAFSDKSTLRRHIITHTGHKRFHCKRCNKRFTRNEHLRQHNYIHTAEKLYKCETCFKDFRQRSTLKNHMLLHRTEGKLTCKACGTFFTRQIHLDKHVPWCKGVPTEGLKCEFCNKRFVDHNVLKRHQVKHCSNQRLRCCHCNVFFEEDAALKKHMLTHKEGSPFHCTLCLKEFSHKIALIEHVSKEHSDQLILEILQPNDYEFDNGILTSEELANNVNYVLQDLLPGEVMNSQVEVCMGNTHMDISTECVSLDLLSNSHSGEQETVPSSSVPTLKRDAVPLLGGQDSLILHMGQKKSVEDSGEESQLLRIQLVRMDDGNNIIQSVEAITPQKKESAYMGSLGSKELTVTNAQCMDIYDAASSESIPKSSPITGENVVIESQDITE